MKTSLKWVFRALQMVFCLAVFTFAFTAFALDRSGGVWVPFGLVGTAIGLFFGFVFGGGYDWLDQQQKNLKN